MTGAAWHGSFWRRWIVANALAELLGLGTVAALGWLMATAVGKRQGPLAALLLAAALVLAGAFEGLVVGLAQARILRQQLPQLRGWVRATVIGAVVAWALGVIPSTVMKIGDAGQAGSPVQIGPALRLLLAAGLGFAVGPVLAFFQWRVLRRHIERGAAWWLSANALAWAAAMPIVFAGAHASATVSAAPALMAWIALSLLAAGGVAGAVHGAALVRRLPRGSDRPVVA